ncbi:MAG: elongation factor P [Pseudomonadota bacterium]
MKVDGNTLRVGNIIDHNGSLWRVMKTQHVKPGKGGAFLQVELRDIRSGTKANERFRSSETVEKVRLSQKSCQFLYSDGDSFAFMDTNDYEQFSIDIGLIGADHARFLADGMQVEVEFHEETPLNVTLPETIAMTVVEADAVVKGQTASSSYKPAVLENGVRVSVPPYIEVGTVIVINTTDCSFVSRAKT